MIKNTIKTGLGIVVIIQIMLIGLNGCAIQRAPLSPPVIATPLASGSITVTAMPTSFQTEWKESTPPASNPSTPSSVITITPTLKPPLFKWYPSEIIPGSYIVTSQLVNAEADKTVIKFYSNRWDLKGELTINKRILGARISSDAHFLAYYGEGNDNIYYDSFYILDLDTGKEFRLSVNNCQGAPSWGVNNKLAIACGQIKIFFIFSARMERG